MRTILTWLLMVLLPAAGWASGACAFDGADDNLNMGSDSSLSPTTGMSMSFWVKRNAVGALHGFITKGATAAAANLRDYDVSVGSNNKIFSQVSNGSAYIISMTTAGSTTELLANKWYHIAWSWDGTTSANAAKLYVNAKLEQQVTATATIATMSDNHDFYVGGNGYAHNGSLDEILFFNTALTAPEIQAMYASTGAWYPKRGLVSRWSFDDNGVSSGCVHANGSTIRDSFGSNNGTVSDGADNSMTLQSSPVRERRGRR